MSSHINELREHLMQTLAGLRDRDNPMEPDRARAVAKVASVLVDTAKVEVEFLKATHGDRSDFLGKQEEDRPALQNNSNTPTAHNPFPTVVRHRLAG